MTVTPIGNSTEIDTRWNNVSVDDLIELVSMVDGEVTIKYTQKTKENPDSNSNPCQDSISWVAFYGNKTDDSEGFFCEKEAGAMLWSPHYCYDPVRSRHGLFHFVHA